MYVPPAFAVTDHDELCDVIDAIGIAHLVSATTTGLVASMVPLVLTRDHGEHGVLRGHLARGNEHWRRLPTAGESLAIFTGPDAYISPAWYPTKAATGKVVPTWNYEVIHARGHLVAHDDAAWLDRHVRTLTDRQERNRPEPWAVDDAPADFVARQLGGIVGIELTITRIEGKRKLSQNRTAADRAGVIAGLGAGDAGERAVAAAMIATADRQRDDGRNQRSPS